MLVAHADASAFSQLPCARCTILLHVCGKGTLVQADSGNLAARHCIGQELHLSSMAATCYARAVIGMCPSGGGVDEHRGVIARTLSGVSHDTNNHITLATSCSTAHSFRVASSSRPESPLCSLTVQTLPPLPVFSASRCPSDAPVQRPSYTVKHRVRSTCIGRGSQQMTSAAGMSKADRSLTLHAYVSGLLGTYSNRIKI